MDIENKKSDEELVREASIWAAEEYERRTLLIAQDSVNRKQTVPLLWISPNSRVDWHEICKKFDMKVIGPVHRVLFQPLFEKEIKKRKLQKVLKGTEKSDEWAKRVGKI